MLARLRVINRRDIGIVARFIRSRGCIIINNSPAQSRLRKTRNMQTDNVIEAPPTGDRVIPYRHWWGLTGCAAVMGLIILMAPYSANVEIPADKGNWWYYWQLADPTVWTRLSAWVLYALHNISIWFLIAQARRARPRYILGLHAFNVWALGINAIFVVLHIFQTKLFYDGLAQDMHEATSFGSVVLMLFLVMVMENRRRGLFFGKSVKVMNSVGDTVRRYHGYYFSWAIIYTFWYHPVEMTQGHLAGFAYMMLLILQSSLFFTRFHTNRWWTMCLETLFVIHGAMVAWFIMDKGDIGPWSQFMFGGLAVFLITQMHGLGLSRKAKLAIALPLLGVMSAFYLSFPNALINLPRVPAIMYIGTFLMFFIVLLLVGFSRLVKMAQPSEANAR